MLGENAESYLWQRFRDSAFSIEDQVAALPADQTNRATILNNRPLAVGSGAVFLTNSPFATPLLFVKSPIVTALISQRSGDTYFLQIINSIVVRCLHLLDDESTIQQELYALLPLAKAMAYRSTTLQRPPTLSHAEPAQEESIIHKVVPPVISHDTSAKEPAAKRPRVSSTVGSEAATPVLGNAPLESPGATPSTQRVRFNLDSELDDKSTRSFLQSTRSFADEMDDRCRCGRGL